ncbi:MAG: UDP-N-acetylmuramoyl-L-alanine--D-glutamate ligase [Bryobacteraceae bacterium]|nr:UDP-N-acetylmuramoyl-L-alanine--D-glutamate ligase [Bryobacteraceae bacterium]
MRIEGAKVAVVGMARSGAAAARLLLARGASVRGVDTKPAAELDTVDGVEYAGQTPRALEGVDLIVLSPGVPWDLDLLETPRKHGVPVIGEVELAGFYLRGPVIGITGSNGKTTTTALTGHILTESGIPCQVGGNIGTPPASMVETSRAGQWNVLELSSFQLETIREFRVKIGAALNLTPDHLDRHRTMEAYSAAKRRLFETQDESGFAVLNSDDAIVASYAKHTRAKPVWFSFRDEQPHGMFFRGEQLYLLGEPWMKRAEIPLPGLHNVENVMAASLCASLAGASADRIAAAVRAFPGVEHRIEFVREIDGVRYYNDSKATNVDATQKAIDSFAGGLWIILGGKDKDSNYSVLAPSLGRKARGVLLIGAAAAKIEAQLGGAAPLISCGTMDRAVAEARARASRGDIVLLAPACASFDQFENYEHRGRVFKKLVAEI